MTNAEVVRDYYVAVARKDLTAARSYLRDDLVFRGLFETFHSADDYLASLAKLLGIVVRLEVNAIIAEGDEVAIFFDLETKAPVVGTTLVAEHHRLANGKISKVRSAFDGRLFETMFTPDGA